MEEELGGLCVRRLTATHQPKKPFSMHHFGRIIGSKSKGNEWIARESSLPPTHFARQWSEPRNHRWTFFFFEHRVDTVLHGTLLHSCCSFLQSWENHLVSCNVF
jgi:hypothetical protein